MNWPEIILIAGPILAVGCLVVVVGYRINKKLNQIIMNATEAADALAALKVTSDAQGVVLTTLGTNLDTQTQLIKSLQAEIANGLELPQTFVDNLNSLSDSINNSAKIASADAAKVAPATDGSGTGTGAPASTDGTAAAGA